MFAARIAQTADERRTCFRLRAIEYRKYYHNVPSDEFCDEFDDLKLPDGSPQARTVYVRLAEQVVGTIRLVVARDARFPDLRSEMLSFMEFDPNGLRPVEPAGTAPLPPLMIGEIGKLAITRCPSVDAKAVLGTTMAAVGQTASRLGVKIIMAAMVPPVERKLRSVGLNFHRVASARLRRNSRDELEFLLKYHQYFLPMLKRRAIDIDASELTQSEASCAVLQALISDCVDGPGAYWLSTEEFVEQTRPYGIVPDE
jgi:hypothetical protein